LLHFDAVKNLYLSSTRHNEGKTLVGLGLAALLAKKVRGVGFMKPIGLASVEFAGDRIDHDVALLKEACRIPAFVKDMGPVTVDGFPAAWAQPAGREEVVEKIKAAYEKVTANKTLVLIEGAGNAASFAAFGLSGAFIAKTLDARVVLIASGGVGQPMDEVILNRSYFERSGVDVAGVILNKAYPGERDRTEKWMRKVLDHMKLPLLGVIPYDHDLSRATLSGLHERFKGKALNHEAGFSAPLGKVVLGAMSAGTALAELSGLTTLLCPVDREDILCAALSAMFLSGRKDFTLASLVIAGQAKLSETAMRMIKRTTIPTLQVDVDPYTVVSEIHAGDFKILPGDEDRIAKAIETVRQNVDLERLLDALKD
jgi:BioD-like phosphotransacetylase family protein